MLRNERRGCLRRGEGGEEEAGRVAHGTAYLLRPRVDVWPAAGCCRYLSFGRLSQRQEITSPLINDHSAAL